MKEELINLVRKLWGTNEINYLRFENRRNQLVDYILHNNESGVSPEKYTNHDIIVSLTTYGKRIYDVAFTIESIMQQSIKPNKIILWLDESFKDKKLPSALLRQRERGLEIAFCTDIRSYKKLIPALCRYPKAAIITVDDDVLYDYDIIERLLYSYIEDPSYIYCLRYHRMLFDNKGKILPYNKWEWRCADEAPSHLNFATGVGGVLYPPHSLDEEVLNEHVFMNICKYADDVWLKAMAIKRGTKVKKVFTRSKHCEDFLLNENIQDVGLRQINIKGECLNDKQLNEVFTKYGIFDLIKE